MVHTLLYNVSLVVDAPQFFAGKQKTVLPWRVLACGVIEH